MNSIIRVFFARIAACLPLIIFLDLVVGVQLIRDFGWLVSAGFFSALIFHAEIYARYVFEGKNGG